MNKADLLCLLCFFYTVQPFCSTDVSPPNGYKYNSSPIISVKRHIESRHVIGLQFEAAFPFSLSVRIVVVLHLQVPLVNHSKILFLSNTFAVARQFFLCIEFAWLYSFSSGQLNAPLHVHVH